MPGSEKGKGDGNRMPDGKLTDLASKFNNTQGEGAFIHLPQQERDRIRESLNVRKPAEFGSMLDQYYRNIATGKPAEKPARNP